MAESLPPILKVPEVYRFINRANQLQSIKPAIAYWCQYHAVNQIVAKGLHTADDDAFAYTKTLLERLESTKTEHATEEAIIDNDVAQAYVEQFAQQTFDRAERTMRANKVTRQTADTFDASATFFDLLREWGELDSETTQKIKFAKWNAARILKAIREGRDPNESNPQIEEESELESAVPLNPNDPDVQLILGATPMPGSIQDPSDHEQVARSGTSVGGDRNSLQEQTLPISDETTSRNTEVAAEDSRNQLSTGSSHFSAQTSLDNITDIPSHCGNTTTSVFENTHHAAFPSPQAQQPARPSLEVKTAPPAGTFTGNHNDIKQAQKHAKFAISALNFDDVPTAVDELRKALAALGPY